MSAAASPCGHLQAVEEDSSQQPTAPAEPEYVQRHDLQVVAQGNGRGQQQKQERQQDDPPVRTTRGSWASRDQSGRIRVRSVCRLDRLSAQRLQLADDPLARAARRLAADINPVAVGPLGQQVSDPRSRWSDVASSRGRCLSRVSHPELRSFAVVRARSVETVQMEIRAGIRGAGQRCCWRVTVGAG